MMVNFVNLNGPGIWNQLRSLPRVDIEGYFLESLNDGEDSLAG